jgi:16S rRNA (guanine527-N7)-methyltransferase
VLCSTILPSMRQDRIAELLKPFLSGYLLSSNQLRSVEAYLELLLKWNSKMNLTAVRDREEIVARHFGESLFAAQKLFPSGDSNQSAIDVGSGAGFPGLPIKLWAPSVRMTLVESNQRKATFLREVIRALKLESVSAVTERAERISERADLVTIRAVEQFERVLPTASSLVIPGGRIAILVGAVQVEAAHSVLPQVKWNSAISVPESRSRVLLIGER